MLSNTGKNTVKSARLYIEKAGGQMDLLEEEYLNTIDNSVFLYQRYLTIGKHLFLNIVT